MEEVEWIHDEPLSKLQEVARPETLVIDSRSDQNHDQVENLSYPTGISCSNAVFSGVDPTVGNDAALAPPTSGNSHAQAVDDPDGARVDLTTVEKAVDELLAK